MGRLAGSICVLALLLAAGCRQSPPAGGGAATVDQARIANSDNEPENWLSYGRTYSEQRFSPLTQVDTGNVAKLGLAWTYETREGRGAEATPIVVDGVMYITSAWNIVYALDAATGKELWVFDPEVDRRFAAWSCCDAVNRGVAVWKGRVYVGTLDGRLVAVDAKTGEKVWDTVTVDQTKAYTITGAPRVAKGLVFIGNSGAEFGVRGYIGAYDAETGKQKWRFYTVPGDPAKGPDNAASDPQMTMMAKTWTGEHWKYGGGGTVWDSIVYDPELDQLIFGVGNGSPWDRKVRSPGGGDNLFLASIVAVDPDTGKYRWHFQTTPGETWDFTATQSIILATLKIGGADRKVLMHAPKNGFFYVLDRATGKFISGKNFVPMAKAADTPKGMPISWAYALDANGRPLENPEARYPDGPTLVSPSGVGAHNWQPMSFSPQTGLVYIPARRVFGQYWSDPNFVFKERFRNAGVFVGKRRYDYAVDRDTTKNDPPELRSFGRGELLAWDPVAQKPAWTVPLASGANSGTLATAGGLVIWGEANARLTAYDARTGRKLLDVNTGLPILNTPITYAVGGVQYVAAMTAATVNGPIKTPGMMPKSRLLVYKLGGTAPLPAYAAPEAAPAPPAVAASTAELARGEWLYAQSCALCHGFDTMGTGVNPDLRRSPAIRDRDTFRAILAGGLAGNGMPDFSKWIKPEEADVIRAYVATQAARAAAGGKPK